GSASASGGSGRTRTRLLAILTTVAVVAALKVSEVVTLPLALGLFMIAVTWPLLVALERRVPRWLAVVCTVLAVLLAGALVAGAFLAAANRIKDVGPELRPRLQSLQRDVAGWAEARNLPVPGSGTESQGAEATGGGGQVAGKLAGVIYSMLEVLGLAFAFMVLGLLEVRDFQAKVRERLSKRFGEPLLQTMGEIASKVRRHLVALTITCAVSGVATGLFALVMGLDLALFWALLAFMLNYVPSLGPLVAIFPPTLFALLQFDGLGRPLAVFAGMGAIQFFIGNFVDPKIEGRVLSMSPMLVLFAIVFWGWIWGVFGALIAVPLTATILIVCDQFESTRWITALLSAGSDSEDG
ncbi:MAG: AI-2E family transporter, partial [Gemmatimonadetes bacterium]|nr:AI-2E family transporter [Gemmatimonadota bacterium]